MLGEAIRNNQIKSNQVSTTRHPFARGGFGRRTFSGFQDTMDDLINQIPLEADLWHLYEYTPIGRRVGDVFPQHTWKADIKIKDGDTNSKFNRAVEQLIKDFGIWNLMTRVDRILAYGQYAVINFNIQDGIEPNLPAGTHNPNTALSFSVHADCNASIQKYDDNKLSPRFDLPEIYRIRTGGNLYGTRYASSGLASTHYPVRTKVVHHSRIIHIAESRTENDVFGKPRLQHISNELKDLYKVSRSATESWAQRTRNPYILSIAANLKLNPQEFADLQRDWEDMVDGGFSRAWVQEYGDVKSVNVPVDDPSKHISALVSTISGGTGIPQRILLGSERGELASSQDANNFAGVVDERRREFCESSILRPFIDKCIKFQILPSPNGSDYEIEWPELVTKSAKDVAIVAESATKALRNLAEIQSKIGSPIISPEQLLDERYELEVDKSALQQFTTEMEALAEERQKKAMEQMEKQSEISGDSPVGTDPENGSDNPSAEKEQNGNEKAGSE